MFLAIVLSAVSLAAMGYALRVAVAMVRERAATANRIARAVRPVHGGPIMRAAPARASNRPGEN